VFASYLIRLSAHSNVEPKYLYHFFQTASYWEQIGLKKGGLQGNVNATTLSSLALPICPLSEQYRIVAKIEELFSELDKGIENLKTSQAQLKVYRQALLKHAFEGKLTAQWRVENQDKLETAAALQAHIQQERAQRYQQQLADWEATGKQGSKPKAPKPLPPLTTKELAELPELPEGWGWTRLGNTNVEVSDGPFGSNLKSSDYVDSGVRAD
jgi:type I restriction enzyme S subunit